MLNRRAFLKRFGLGVAAACALASIPESAVKALSVVDAGRFIACEYLQKIYREWCAAHPGCEPTRMESGLQLFEAFEAELIVNWRFTETSIDGPRNLRFKGARLDCVGVGWQAHVAEHRDTRMARARALVSA